MSRYIPWLLPVLFCLWGVLPGVAQDAGWRPADAPRQWAFPRDHGAHPEYATEWWYFTGNLTDAEAHAYGYQFTVFRVGVRRAAIPEENPWSVRDVYLAHLAVTDGGGQRFHWAERISRAGPGLAGASLTGLDVWVLDWQARQDAGAVLLTANTADFGLALTLRPDKPVVLHGQGGLSRKGPRPGQASHYASLTSLATTGTLRLTPDAEPIAVHGQSWFDQEFGSNQLAADQEGWDWFSLHLGDGRELMLYLLRRTDGSVEAASSGTLVAADGQAAHLALGQFQVEVLDTWTSPRSGAVYPSRWRIAVPAHGISLEIGPLLADQELVTTGSTGVVYWEGAVTGTGTSGPCRGYVELTGYAGALGGLF